MYIWYMVYIYGITISYIVKINKINIFLLKKHKIHILYKSNLNHECHMFLSFVNIDFRNGFH